MPKSFLVKKNTKWRRAYRKLQLGIASTAYDPERDGPPSPVGGRIPTPEQPVLREQPTPPSPLKQIDGTPNWTNCVPSYQYTPQFPRHPLEVKPLSRLLPECYNRVLPITSPMITTMTSSPPLRPTGATTHYVSPPLWSDEENFSPSSSPGSDGEKGCDKFVLKKPARRPKTNAEKYACEDCGKLYCTVGGLGKHRQAHCRGKQSERKFQCKLCPKEYSALGALKMHLRTHTLPCKCNFCGKAFSRPWLLQGHIRTHTGEKPFSCVHCQRAFADRSNLRAHLQTHSQVKRYSCQHCARTFSRMSLLQKHRDSGCEVVLVSEQIRK